MDHESDKCFPDWKIWDFFGEANTPSYIQEKKCIVDVCKTKLKCRKISRCHIYSFKID